MATRRVRQAHDVSPMEENRQIALGRLKGGCSVVSGSLKTLAVGDITGKFFVPSYQRGYRWTSVEVGQLLDDIRNSGGATYYLQPIVVKARSDGSWELVDGQQRLTTMYLILRYLQATHLPSANIGYSLTYQTREGSQSYLERLDAQDAASNIDFAHMFNAYRCIEGWFDQFGHRTTHEATQIYGHLFSGVKILWYEAAPEVDSHTLFTRLNVGRIPLTDAELVKAQLLSHGRDGDGQTDRATEMAVSWDRIERDLRTPELWAFITGRDGSDATHISLLLHTLAGTSRGHERLPFQTFEALRPVIARDAKGFWEQVVGLHSLVMGWYEDRDLFHKVGFLIAAGKSFDELVRLSQGRGRSEFEYALDERIRGHLKMSRDDLMELTYTSRKTGDALLLMNVETIRRRQDSAERYSFRRQARDSWSLEHIHAQNAEPLTRAEQWEEWLRSHAAALSQLPSGFGGLDEPSRADLLARVEEALSAQITQQSFSALEREFTEVFSLENESENESTHSIGNLALLGRNDNSALNNSVFEVKRQVILELDRRGAYIPVCTRNVFLKYYTATRDQQPHYWSTQDRTAYVSEMCRMLEPYLITGEEADL